MVFILVFSLSTTSLMFSGLSESPMGISSRDCTPSAGTAQPVPDAGTFQLCLLSSSLSKSLADLGEGLVKPWVPGLPMRVVLPRPRSPSRVAVCGHVTTAAERADVGCDWEGSWPRRVSSRCRSCERLNGVSQSVAFRVMAGTQPVAGAGCFDCFLIFPLTSHPAPHILGPEAVLFCFAYFELFRKN